MAIYQEETSRWYNAALLLMAAFLLIYSPWWLSTRELLWNEGDYAAIAVEMDSVFPLITAHGEIVNGVFPLFPMLALLLHKYCGLNMELALRLLSIMPLACITVLVWDAARRALNQQAAHIAAAAVFSSVIVIEKTIDGYPNLLAFLFIFTAWLLWFTFGVVRSCWNKAWIYSLFFCGLGFFTLGWEALIYFFLPLIFMRRPMTVWQKLQKPGFFVGLGLVVFFIVIWIMPRWYFAEIPSRPLSGGNIEIDDYIVQLLTFPFTSMFKYLPWLFIAWTPFCVAYHPLDKNPLFSRFLRTIFISIFFFLWFSPFTKPRDLIILAPPIAILCGINYWLFVRRNGFIVHKLMRWVSYLAIFAGVATIIFYSMPPELLKSFYMNDINFSFRWMNMYIIAGILQSVLVIIIAVNILVKIRRGELKVWEHLLLVSVMFMLFYWSLLAPYKSQDASKRQLGSAFRSAIGASFNHDMTVYKDKNINGLYGESYYLGCNVRKLQSYEQLPSNEKTVYLIGIDVPVFPGRLWTNLLPEQIYKDKKICLWKGEKVEKSEKK